MIRTVLTLTMPPENVDAVLAQYAEDGILQYSLDHSDALSTELSVSTDGSGVIVVIALWPDRDSYQAWLDNPWRAGSSERLAALLGEGGVGAGAVLEIRESLSRPSQAS